MLAGVLRQRQHPQQQATLMLLLMQPYINTRMLQSRAAAAAVTAASLSRLMHGSSNSSSSSLSSSKSSFLSHCLRTQQMQLRSTATIKLPQQHYSSISGTRQKHTAATSDEEPTAPVQTIASTSGDEKVETPTIILQQQQRQSNAPVAADVIIRKDTTADASPTHSHSHTLRPLQQQQQQQQKSADGSTSPRQAIRRNNSSTLIVRSARNKAALPIRMSSPQSLLLSDNSRNNSKSSNSSGSKLSINTGGNESLNGNSNNNNSYSPTNQSPRRLQLLPLEEQQRLTVAAAKRILAPTFDLLKPTAARDSSSDSSNTKSNSSNNNNNSSDSDSNSNGDRSSNSWSHSYQHFSLPQFQHLRRSWYAAVMNRLLPIGYASEGNTVDIYADGDEAFTAMFAAINSARSRVLFETFIWRPDAIGIKMLAALTAAAHRGCEVVVLYDGVGSLGMHVQHSSQFFAPLLASPNATVTVFNPVFTRGRLFWPLQKRGHSLWFRTHRKILVVDESVGFAGGMNCTAQYAGIRSSSSSSSSSGSSGGVVGGVDSTFRDTHMRLRGPAVQHLAAVFVASLTEATGRLVWKQRLEAWKRNSRRLLSLHNSKHPYNRLYQMLRRKSDGSAEADIIDSNSKSIDTINISDNNSSSSSNNSTSNSRNSGITIFGQMAALFYWLIAVFTGNNYNSNSNNRNDHSNTTTYNSTSNNNNTYISSAAGYINSSSVKNNNNNSNSSNINNNSLIFRLRSNVQQRGSRIANYARTARSRVRNSTSRFLRGSNDSDISSTNDSESGSRSSRLYARLLPHEAKYRKEHSNDSISTNSINGKTINDSNSNDSATLYEAEQRNERQNTADMQLYAAHGNQPLPQPYGDVDTDLLLAQKGIERAKHAVTDASKLQQQQQQPQQRLSPDQEQQQQQSQPRSVTQKQPQQQQLQQPPGDVFVQVLQSNLIRNTLHVQRVMHASLDSAAAFVLITNPFFLPPPALHKALLLCAGRGVKISVLTCGKSDTPYMRWAATHVYHKYITAGIDIYEYNSKILHAKTMTVDGVYSSVGSFNMDVLSGFALLELNIAIIGNSVAQQLQRQFAEDVKHATRMTLSSLDDRSVLEKLLHWATYQFSRVMAWYLNLVQKH